MPPPKRKKLGGGSHQRRMIFFVVSVSCLRLGQLKGNRVVRPPETSPRPAANIADLGITEEDAWAVVGWPPREFDPELYRAHQRALFDIRPKTLTFEVELIKRLVRTYLEACDAVGILTYARGGTLFGAIRHHGFIPWDDDFDVVLDVSDDAKLGRLKEALRLDGVVIASVSTGLRRIGYARPLAWKTMDGHAFPTFDLVPVVRKDGHFVSAWYQRYGMPQDLIGNVEPVVYRPFSGLSMPVPNNITRVYNERLTLERLLEECTILPSLQHFDSSKAAAKGRPDFSVPCRALHHVLPMTHKIVLAKLGGDAYYVEQFGDPVDRSYQLWLTPHGRGGVSMLASERTAPLAPRESPTAPVPINQTASDGYSNSVRHQTTNNTSNKPSA